MKKLAASAYSDSVNVVAPPNRNISTWVGASVLSDLSTFDEMCIKKTDYDEVGPIIVHKKCV